MSKKITLVAVSFLGLSGCAIHQNVRPVNSFQEKEICIIENPSVREGFYDSYRRALTAKGYAVKRLPVSASIRDCGITSTYTAKWRWDLALYMAYSEIKVYGNGQLIGEATYDSQRGGGNMGKFIDADKKITELTNQLFPGEAGM